MKRYLILGIFIIALLIRLIGFFLLEVHSKIQPDSIWAWPVQNTDAAQYQLLAVSLKQNNQYHGIRDQPTAYRPPLYPLWMSLIYRLTFSTHPWVIIFFQILLSSLSCILIFELGKIHFTENIAFWGAIVMAINPFIAYFSCQLLTETLFIFLYLFFLWTLSQKNPARPIISGVVAGLCALCRPTGMLFILLGFVYHLRLWDFKNLLWKNAALFLLLAILTLTPWTLRNWQKGLGFHPVSTNGAANLLLGMHRHWLQSIHVQGLTFDRLQFEHLPEGQRSARQYGLALQLIKTHPQHFLKITLIKGLHFFSPKPSATYPAFARIISIVFVSFLLLLGLCGLLHHRSEFSHFLLTLMISYSALHTITLANIRFRIPVLDSLLGLYAVYATATWVQAWNRKNLSPKCT
jgi:4-amino-4-deoxy-L-arabinose transferase-like glycosyltransferase